MVVRDSILQRYGPAECRAIDTHKYFLGLERGYDPPIAEAVESWERRFAFSWRSKKLRCDMEAQTQAIECHRRSLARDRHCEVSITDAARDWVEHHGANWRAERESNAAFDPHN